MGSMPLAARPAVGAAGVLAGLGGRRTAALSALLAAAAIVDDVGGGPQYFRRPLPRRTTWNVVAEAGDPERRATRWCSSPTTTPPRRPDLPPRAPRLVADRFPGWYDAPEHLAADDARGRRPGAGRARRADRRAAAAPDRHGDRRSAARSPSLDIGDPRRRARRQRQPHLVAVAARARAAAARGAAPRRARAARLDRLGGVVHGGDARLGAPPRARRSTARARASWCSRRSARRS